MKLIKNAHLIFFLFAILFAACDGGKTQKGNLPPADPDNAGLKLQPNFGAIVTWEEQDIWP